MTLLRSIRDKHRHAVLRRVTSLEDAKKYTSKWTVEEIIRNQSGHVPVPIRLVEKEGAEPSQVSDGAALWVKQKNEISKQDYVDFYRSVSGQYDEPLSNVHFRAEGRHEYTTLAFIPGSQPFDVFDPDRHGRMKLYVKRVFITDDAELLPRYLRFVRGIVDTSDLPLNISREMIQKVRSSRPSKGRDEPDPFRAGEDGRARRRDLCQVLGYVRGYSQGRHL